jgi:hypothetical protein
MSMSPSRDDGTGELAHRGVLTVHDANEPQRAGGLTINNAGEPAQPFVLTFHDAGQLRQEAEQGRRHRRVCMGSVTNLSSLI